MANKDLFKQAIAEAKSVREAAIANAKEALEETLTPHLKDMLAAKLQEMDATSEEVEEVVNESEEEVNEAPKDDKKDESIEEAPKKDKDMDEAPKKDKDMDEAMKDDKKDEAIEEVSEELEEVEVAETPIGEEDDSDESEDEAPEEDHDDHEEEEIDGDEDISKLSVDQFKDMIKDIIAQEVGGDAPADDMDAGDIEGMGDEEPAIDDVPAIDAPEEEGEEIDLDELIRELDAISEADKDEKEMEEGKKEDDMDESTETVEEDTSVQVNAESDGSDYNINRVADLKEALDTIETLKKELNEVNILNAKLLYVNKIFKANNLSESQKVNVIAAFDKAETVKEVKLVFETVADNVGTKKETTIKEHKGSASKATGTTASKPEVIAEVSSAVLRMQKLAGIIK